MNNSNNSNTGKTIIGVVLIVAGILFLLRSMHLLPFFLPHSIPLFPIIILILGLVIISSSNNKVMGIIFVLWGTLLILPKIFPEIEYDGSIFWPLLVLGIGIHILLKHRTCCVTDENNNSVTDINKINDLAIFGGGTKILKSQNFKGGNISAIFGGSEIDLRDCKLAEGTNTINVLALFGGTEIFVPADWNIIINVTPLFGGFSDKRRTDPSVQIDHSKTLVIKGLALFGGGDVKN